ncbi:hypothetical protein HPB48_008591 [Haemaphysalis longicornis]|uniref:Uncharacterized protein n=1 Tax=Haemaphysalis longicornis TaxID=44386 RepID=A0A9J6GRQ4_HAELO|nr:hypothetical protein HPB48_008591 [Haemaphysalis longicornis]
MVQVSSFSAEETGGTVEGRVANGKCSRGDPPSAEIADRDFRVAHNSESRGGVHGKRNGGLLCILGRCGRNVFTTVHKVLIVGVAYTSIVASECSFITGRTRAIIDSEFAKRGRTSPMTVTEFLFFMFPMSLVTSVIFWFYIYGVYLQQAVSPVVTTYLLVVLVIGVPRELGNPFLSHPSLVWPILLTYLPWDMIIMRIGGMELAHLARARDGTAFPSCCSYCCFPNFFPIALLVLTFISFNFFTLKVV